MKAVVLDAATLGDDVDWEPVAATVTDLRICQATAPHQLAEHCGDADLILTNKVVIDRACLAGRTGVLVLATGTNNVDLAAAAESGVPVLNVANYGTRAVAQHTLMLMLALSARLPLYQRDVAAGAWQRSPMFCLMDHRPLQLAGKTLVLVGSGNLGSAVAELARAFAMEVQFAARPGGENDHRPSLDSLLPQADVLSFHCPLTDATRHLLDRRRLQTLKAGCLVVNCARGGIIDEVAALDALVAGKIGGLAVDVLPEEPPRGGHPLLDALDDDLNLIVTPHNAWSTREARQAIVDLTAANILSLGGE